MMMTVMLIYTCSDRIYVYYMYDTIWGTSKQGSYLILVPSMKYVLLRLPNILPLWQILSGIIYSETIWGTSKQGSYLILVPSMKCFLLRHPNILPLCQILSSIITTYQYQIRHQWGYIYIYAKYVHII